MAKLTLNDISAGYISITTYNSNNTLLEAALENTLSRNGTSPNAMGANLDMNSFRITNLVTAVNNSEPVTLGQANTLAGVTNPLTQTNVGDVLYPRTAAETSAGVTPTNNEFIPNEPARYGATGDGVVDDTTEYALAESVTSAGSILLGRDLNYDLASTKPVNLVYGPGSITLTGSGSSPKTSGFQVLFDVAAGSIVSVPDVWAENANSETSSPGSLGSYFNVILAPGSNANDTANNNVWRCTILGEAAGEYISEWERVEAIGSGCMRFSEYAQRTTAIGTIALSWLGATSQQNLKDRFHDFWGAGGFDPGHASWDFAGLETDNPGIGTTINAFSSYPTNTSTVSQNVAIGRDAGLHLVKGSSNTYIGYQSGAHAFNGGENTAVGAFSLKDNVFGTKNIGVGWGALAELSEGLGNIAIGHESGEDLVDGNRNFFIGGSAGQGYALSASNKYNNKFIMESFSLGHFLGGDMNIANLFINHGTNELADFEAEGSGFYNVVSTGTTPATPGRFLGTTTSSVSTLASYAGSTSNRNHATFENTNGVVGTITTNGTATAYNTSSDIRLKFDLGLAKNALKDILLVKIHDFYFENDDKKVEKIGVFSQELEKIFPDAVTGDADGMTDIGDIFNEAGDVIKSNTPKPNTDKVRWKKTGEIIKSQQVDYSKLVAPLLAAVQEQQKQIDELKLEIAKK